MNLKKIEKKIFYIIFFSVIATFNAIYLTYKAYTINLYGVSNLYVCDINTTFSCSTVFSNSFSWIFGIPFSLYALFVYPIIIVVALLGYFKKINNHYKIIVGISIGGLLFNGYIIINEYIISTYCFLCLICTLIIIINLGISLKGIKEYNNSYK